MSEECTYCGYRASMDEMYRCTTKNCYSTVCLTCGIDNYENYETYLEFKKKYSGEPILSEKQFEEERMYGELCEVEDTDFVCECVICKFCVDRSDLEKENKKLKENNVKLQNTVNKLKLLLLSSKIDKDNLENIYKYL